MKVLFCVMAFIFAQVVLAIPDNRDMPVAGGSMRIIKRSPSSKCAKLKEPQYGRCIQHQQSDKKQN